MRFFPQLHKPAHFFLDVLYSMSLCTVYAILHLCLQVYFLTVGKPGLFKDERMNSVEAAIALCKTCKLLLAPDRHCGGDAAPPGH